jgi:hypothetical protein
MPFSKHKGFKKKTVVTFVSSPALARRCKCRV